MSQGSSESGISQDFTTMGKPRMGRGSQEAGRGHRLVGGCRAEGREMERGKGTGRWVYLSATT